MEFVNLCKKYDEKQFEAYKTKQIKEIEQYYKFVLSLVEDKKIINKITTNYKNIIAYVLDSSSTEVPRNLYGENKPARIPRAAAFVREQTKKEQDGVIFDDIKHGIALRIQEHVQGVIFHELNHAFSSDFIAVQKEGALYKNGMNVRKLNLKDDKYEDVTGDLVDESLTDAIAYHYYQQNNQQYADENGKTILYSTAYNGIRLFSTILL